MPSLLSLADLRHSIRLLARTPAFSLLVVTVLSGGLAVSIFTFGFLHRAMVAPLPLDEGESIVRISGAGDAGQSFSLDASTLALIRPTVSTLTDIGIFVERGTTLGSGNSVRPIAVTATEPSLFTLARTPARLGRVLVAEDMAPGAEPVIVLSHALWQGALGGDSSIVGRTIEVGGAPTRVIGVMPPGFGFPVASESWVPAEGHLLDPVAADLAPVGAFGRVTHGVTRAQSEAELSVQVRRVRAEHPARADESPLADGVLLRSFPMAQMGEEGPLVFVVLNLLAGLILLLACVNAGNLLLARADERSREMAIRQALGAPRGRLAMQGIWDIGVLCLVSGLLAALLATAGLRMVDGWAVSNLTGNLAFWWRWGFDRTVLLATAGFVGGAILLVGGLLSLRAGRERILDTLREGGNGSVGQSGGRLARTLVLAQVVIVSLVMFAGGLAGIVGRRVLTVDLGFDPTHLLGAGVSLPQSRFPEEGLYAAHLLLATRLEEEPGIDGVIIRSTLADRSGPEGAVEVAGRPAETVALPRAHVQAVLRPLGLVGASLREGRDLLPGDDRNGAPVAVVSQAMAREQWGDTSPIGRQLRLTGIEGPDAPWRTIVGVVADVPLGNPLSRDRSPLAVYVPLGQFPSRWVDVVTRHAGGESAGRAAILRALASVDPSLLPSSVSSMDEILRKSSLIATSTARMFAGCFVFALLLSISGTYGLMARTVVRRTREIGVRRALGATDAMVVRMLVWQGGRHLGVGAVIALPLTVLAGVAFGRVFPIGTGVAIATAGVVAIVVGATVLLASWLPSRRALRIAPVEVLRGE